MQVPVTLASFPQPGLAVIAVHANMLDVYALIAFVPKILNCLSTYCELLFPVSIPLSHCIRTLRSPCASGACCGAGVDAPLPACSCLSEGREAWPHIQLKKSKSLVRACKSLYFQNSFPGHSGIGERQCIHLWVPHGVYLRRMWETSHLLAICISSSASVAQCFQ